MASSIMVLTDEHNKPVKLSPAEPLELLVKLASPSIKVVKVVTFTGRDDFRDGSARLGFGLGLQWPELTGWKARATLSVKAPKPSKVTRLGSREIATLTRANAETAKITEAEAALLGSEPKITAYLRLGARQWPIAENVGRGSDFSHRQLDGESKRFTLNGEVDGLRFTLNLGMAEAVFTPQNTGPARYGLPPVSDDKPAETQAEPEPARDYAGLFTAMAEAQPEPANI